MFMLPGTLRQRTHFTHFVKFLKELVDEGKVSKDRIDDAVKRILKVKYEMNLFNRRTINRKLTEEIGSKEHREVARDAVRQSLVLLKNKENILPLSKKIKRIHIAGIGGNNLGMMCGGWTVTWQGEFGKVTPGGTTILEAIKNAVSSDTKVTYSEDGGNVEGADVCIVVVGERPYAEKMGDRRDLNLSENDMNIVKKVKNSGAPVVTILLSGRPMIIGDVLNNSNAFIAAWLPGTEGDGITDVLFGDFKPVGKLSFSWPKDMLQIPINIGDENYAPLFPYGFGLTY